MRVFLFFIFIFALWGPYSPASTFGGTCTGEEMVKMLEAGFSKSEILQACGVAEQESGRSEPVGKKSKEEVRKTICLQMENLKNTRQRNYEDCRERNRLRMEDCLVRRRHPEYVPDPGFNPCYQEQCIGWRDMAYEAERNLLKNCQ